MPYRYREEELIEFLLGPQKGRCSWCRKALDPEERGTQWELHHHPAKSW